MNEKNVSLQLNKNIMWKDRIIFFGLLMLLAGSLAGQSVKIVNSNPNVIVHRDARLDSLVALQQDYLKENPKIDGWRVEIFFEGGNNSYNQALSRKSSFVLSYPDIPVYLTFNAPYYKVRVGDFIRRSDAELFLQKIKAKYPNAFVVKEEINFPKLP